jgi:hypothetical protein
MYKASEQRYENMVYNRSGASGVKLPAVSLGFWHNFGYATFVFGIEIAQQSHSCGDNCTSQ